MAGTKRKIGTEEIIPKPQLLYRINKMDSARDRALAAFIYMSGCRISEILGTKKHIKIYKKNGGPKELTDIKELDIRPLAKENIEFLETDKLMLIHNVPCLKRRDTIPRRIIPVYIPQVAEFFIIFYNYYKDLQPGAPLFSITRQRAWQIIKEKTGLFNHFLIHERLTHLTVQNQFSSHDLKMFRGWSSTSPADNYIHLVWRDIARKQGAQID